MQRGNPTAASSTFVDTVRGCRAGKARNEREANAIVAASIGKRGPVALRSLIRQRITPPQVTLR
jgi:hypothetical protein